MRRGAARDWREVPRPTPSPQGFRYSMLIVAPALAGADRRRGAADRRVCSAQLQPARRRDAAGLRRPARALDRGRAARQPAAAGAARARARPPRQRAGAGPARPPRRRHGDRGACCWARPAWSAPPSSLPPCSPRCSSSSASRTGAGPWPARSPTTVAGFRPSPRPASAAGALLATLLADGLPETILAGALGCAFYAVCLLLAVPRLLQVMLGAIRPKKADEAEAQPVGVRPASSSISAR